MNLNELKDHIKRGGKIVLRDFSYDPKNERLTLIVSSSLCEGNASSVVVEGAAAPTGLHKGHEIYGIAYYPKLQSTEVHLNIGTTAKFQQTDQSPKN
jgi:hypothetical protein